MNQTEKQQTIARNVRLEDGRTLHVHASAPAHGADARTLVLHHGSPQTGALLAPFLAAAASRGIRLVSYGRPGYDGSSPSPGRDVASAATDVAHLADALGLARFAVLGLSGGGPHALACAALLPDRVTAVVCLASLAPYTEDFDWFAGMADVGGLRAAFAGRAKRARYAETAAFDAESLTAADWTALRGRWSSLGADAARASTAAPDGLIDDDVAFVARWGFEVATVDAPVLLVHGGADRIVPPAHAHWLLRHCPRPELWFRPNEGHISILDTSPLAMDWVLAHGPSEHE